MFKKFGEDTRILNRRVMLNLVEEKNDAKILDLGCGDGEFTRLAGQKIGSSQLFGIEGQLNKIKQCDANGVKVVTCDLNKVLPLESESFDVVIASQILEHISSTDLVIKEIYRVLKKDGYAIISTPNLAVWHNALCLLLGYQLFTTSISDEVIVGNPLTPDYKNKIMHPYDSHRRIFTYRGLKELFEYHGFAVERLVGDGYPPFSGSLARLVSRIDSRHAMFLTLKGRKSFKN